MPDSRYIRQTTLLGFGEEGQEALRQAHVLVVGAGGLGCPVLQNLTAMGIGSIGIVDHDMVALSNLHRQMLYSTADVGKLKVEAAGVALNRLNPDVQIQTFAHKLTQENCLTLLQNYSIIVDCTDNFTSRYMLNDACVLLGKPLIYGAVSGYEGQVAVFNHPKTDGSFSGNYRDLHPDMPRDGEVLNCEDGGILGVLASVIGSLQASEAVKVICKIGVPLIDKLLCYSMLTHQSYTLNYKKNPTAILPDSASSFYNTSYTQACTYTSLEIDPTSLANMLLNPDFTFVDVRELGEEPQLTTVKCFHFPLSKFQENLPFLPSGKIVFVCQSGTRSLKAAQLATTNQAENRFFSLRGGIKPLTELT